jgi:hypothetical protein
MAALLLLATAWVRRADAYDQKVHVYLSKRAYGGAKTVAPEDDAARRATRALRERIWRAGAEAKDPVVKQRFLQRWPSLDKLDAWELKVLLGLNPDKTVAGLDEGALPPGSDGAELYGLASRLPDDDFRNRDRFRHDAQRKVVDGPFGQPLPDDPATLEMGSLTGLSSQAHAHYQLARLSFSDDPDVLKKEPRRFAIPPTVQTFGADYAEVYTALAVMASRLPSGERLALVHAGAAAHHVEDVANQIHTVQVGVYDFFVDAKLESWKEELRSVGGLLRARPTFVSIGIDIIANHHSLAEALYEKHLLASGDPVRAQTEAAPPDPVFDATLAKLPAGCAPGFGRAIVEALAERSSLEGADVYAAIRAVAERRFSRVGHRFHGGDDPDAALRPGADLGAFYALEVRGAIRSDQALGAWWQRFGACAAAGPEVEAQFAERLITDRLSALEAKEARARAYTPKPATKAALNPWVPGGYAFLLALLVWIWRRMSKRRARSTKG